MMMIADPCNAPLEPGIHGSDQGLLARTISYSANTSGAAQGYCIWFPSFTNNPDAADEGAGSILTNIFTFCPAAPSTAPAPLNFGFAADWSGGNNTAASLPDPAYGLVGNNMCADARTISACMSMTYTGKMQDSSGSFAFVNNIPFTTLYGNGTADRTPANPSYIAPATIDDLFVYAGHASRLGTDTLENIHVNVRDDPKFYSSDEGFEMVSADYPVQTSGVHTQDHTGFGFVWRGLSLGTGNPNANLTFGFTKNLEWRATPILGMANVPPKMEGPSKIPLVTRALQAVDPLFNNRLKDGSSTLGSLVSKAAQTGVAYGMKQGKKHAHSYVEDLLSGALRALPSAALMLL
jgi:hypothetical protein